MKTVKKTPAKKSTVPPAPPAPGIDRDPDVTNWLAKWANITAAIRVLCRESTVLACTARPKAWAYKKHVVKALGLDREKLDAFDRHIQELHGFALVTPFRGTLARVGDGVLEHDTEQGE